MVDDPQLTKVYGKDPLKTENLITKYEYSQLNIKIQVKMEEILMAYAEYIATKNVSASPRTSSKSTKQNQAAETTFEDEYEKPDRSYINTLTQDEIELINQRKIKTNEINNENQTEKQSETLINEEIESTEVIEATEILVKDKEIQIIEGSDIPFLITSWSWKDYNASLAYEPYLLNWEPHTQIALGNSIATIIYNIGVNAAAVSAYILL